MEHRLAICHHNLHRRQIRRYERKVAASGESFVIKSRQSAAQGRRTTIRKNPAPEMFWKRDIVRDVCQLYVDIKLQKTEKPVADMTPDYEEYEEIDPYSDEYNLAQLMNELHFDAIYDASIDDD